jgi:hypothetical protein
LLILALGVLGQAAGAACLKPAIERAAQQVRDVRHAMLALPVADNMTTDVPPEAQRQIASMKARLGDLVDAYMRCAAAPADAKQIERDLVQLARGSDPDPTDDDRYGGRIDFDVRMTAGPPQLASILATFSIHCGSDAALFVFSRQADDWREILRWHSKDYATVAGGLWAFDYSISSPDQSGAWFVVTKGVAPWCSSTWSEIRISVLRPKPANVIPAELFGRSYSMWWGGDDFGSVSADAGGFTLRYHSAGKNADDLDVPYVRRFHVSGYRVSPAGR